MFLNELCSIHRSLGLPPSDYRFHAFCQGRVSFVFQAGIPVELINKLGDWYSDAVLLYLTVPLPIRLQSVHLFTKAITSHQHHFTPHFGFGVLVFIFILMLSKVFTLINKGCPNSACWSYGLGKPSTKDWCLFKSLTKIRDSGTLASLYFLSIVSLSLGPVIRFTKIKWNYLRLVNSKSKTGV